MNVDFVAADLNCDMALLHVRSLTSTAHHRVALRKFACFMRMPNACQSSDGWDFIIALARASG